MKDHPSDRGVSFSTLPFIDQTGYEAHAFRICEGRYVCGKGTSRNTMADNFLLSWQKNWVPGYQLQLRI